MSMSVGGVGGGGNLHAMSGASSKRSMGATLNDIFSTMDPAGTGAVSKEAFGATMANVNAPGLMANMTPNELFDRLDPNGDGSLTREEFRDGMRSLIDDIRSKRGDSFAEILAKTGAGSNALSQGTMSLTSALSGRPGKNIDGSTFSLYA